MALYGGFAGTETSSADRNPAANVTILTGDLAKDDPHVNGVTVSADLISGDNSLRVVKAPSGCGLTTVLDGFTITAGDNNSDNGGGMSIESSSPTVTGCTFSGNVVGINGGGMYNGDPSDATSSPTVKDCTFSGNTAGNRGGGLCNENNNKPIVTNCTFSDNNATYGGGMYNNGGNPIVTNCTFTGNTAGSGGGMYNYNGSNPAVTHCTFSANSASDGGGMYNYNGSPTVTNCTFSSNSAISEGGGMYNYNNCVPIVRNCTFSGNSASDGGGMNNAYNNGAPIVTNSIFWGDTGGEIVYAGFTAVAPTVTYSDVQGGYPTGTNIITDDPKLGSLAYNGGPTKTHALSADSPAIDKGWTFDASVISTDQRGVARPQGVSFDIGAYEYWEKQILTVTTIGNGSVAPSPLGVVVGTTGTCWGYDNETPVILTASEDARSVFVSWGGDASGTSLTTTVTMDDTKNVEASFDDAWIVTVSAGPGGDITPSAPGAGSAGRFAPDGRGASGTTTVKVRDGANKTFTVTPNTGYSIGSVRIDGTIDPAPVLTYTFTNVTEDHSIEATFTENPTPSVTPTPIPSVTPTLIPSVTPTTAPTDSPAPTAGPTTAPTATPTPVPTPDPDIPLPKVTLKITLYAGGTLVAGPFDITDPATLSALLASPTLLAQLLATAPSAILSGQYNMDLIRFFSLVADLDDGVLDFTILFELRVEGVPAGYRAQLFVLTRTFDSNGNPTGYAIVPRNEGASVFRKRSGARGWTKTWRVTVRDGGVTDGDARQDGSVAPQIAAVVAVFPMASPTVTVTVTPTQGSTGSGGGCAIPANGSAILAALLLLSPMVLMRRR